MKNLKKPKGDYYISHKEFYETRLKSSNKKNTLWKLTNEQEQGLKNAFDQYEENFNNNTLDQLKKFSFFTDTEKEKYLWLYDHSLKYYQDMNDNARFLNGYPVCECPFCENGQPDTLDHILPKTVNYGFPEFCDNPLNLIPMCPTCNGHKSKAFTDTNGKQLFINLYRDILPDKQYLIATFNFDDKSIPTVKFSIDNTVIVDSDLYKKLDYTFDKLHLYEFYEDNSPELLGTLQITIQNHKNNNFTEEQIKQIIQDNNPLLNFWVHVLYRSAIKNKDLFNILYNNLYT